MCRAVRPRVPQIHDHSPLRRQVQPVLRHRRPERIATRNLPHPRGSRRYEDKTWHRPNGGSAHGCGATPDACAGTCRRQGTPPLEIRNQLGGSTQLPSIAVAVVRGDAIVWEEAFGWADQQRRIAAKPATPYYLASITKTFTGMALALLASEGRIDMNRSVNAYLGSHNVRPALWDENAITVERVADHTAGLSSFYLQCDSRGSAASTRSSTASASSAGRPVTFSTIRISATASWARWWPERRNRATGHSSAALSSNHLGCATAKSR